MLSFPAERFPGRKYPAVSTEVLNRREVVLLTDMLYMQKLLLDLATDCSLKLKTAVVVKSLGAQIAVVRVGIDMVLTPSGIERFCNHG